MKNNTFIKRLDIFRDSLGGRGPDTAWIIQPENRRYLSGFKALDPQLNESSGSLLVSKKKAFLITDSRYKLEAEREAKDFEIIILKKDMVEDLTGLLVRLKTTSLGFEENHLTYGLYRRLSGSLKKLHQPVRLKPLDNVINGMREIKDPSEIKIMESASDIISGILDEVISNLRPGKTEIAVAREIEMLSHDAGADGVAFPPIVASGPNGALPHALPTKRKILSKEPIIFDVGVKLDGYCCDMTRTVFLDTPGPRFRKIYRTVREAQISALKNIRPGIESVKPDSTARDIIKAAGFGNYFGHALGHGVGLAVHEGPRLGPNKPIILKAGMVVTVEPGIYLPGIGGVRLEEMVVIEKNGPRILTKNSHFYKF